MGVAFYLKRKINQSKTTQVSLLTDPQSYDQSYIDYRSDRKFYRETPRKKLRKYYESSLTVQSNSYIYYVLPLKINYSETPCILSLLFDIDIS